MASRAEHRVGAVWDDGDKGVRAGGDVFVDGALGAHLRVALAERVIAEGLSVRQTERLAALQAAQEKGGPASRGNPAGPSPEVRDLEDRLRESLGTRVEIKARGKRGRLIIHFAGHDEFERLLERISRP